jgi:hypothetical protein
VQRPGRSTETARRLEVTLNPAHMAAQNRARSAVMTAVARQGAIHRAAAPATAADPMAAEHLTAVGGAGLGNRALNEFLEDRKNL